MRQSQRKLLTYLLGAGLTGVALGIRLAMPQSVRQETPFLLFLAAVTLAAVVGGLGPGLMATGLSALAANFFFLPPYFELSLTDPDQLLKLGLFVVEGVIISVLCSLLYKARMRAEQHAAEASQLRDRVITISQAEQARIGRDLHDGLGQHLSAMAFLGESLARRLERDHNSHVAEARRLADMAAVAIGQTRDLARGLSPVAMEAGSLPVALRKLAESVEQVSAIQCRFEDTSQGVELEADVATHLYRLAQEAVSNAVRHAQAREVRLCLRGPAPVELTIQDDGRGIAPGASTVGLGLEIMRHRARLIGAHLEIVAPPSGGTLVRCVLNHRDG